eukprot:2258739-Rhodomonas_salina.1
MHVSKKSRAGSLLVLCLRMQKCIQKCTGPQPTWRALDTGAEHIVFAKRARSALETDCEVADRARQARRQLAEFTGRPFRGRKSAERTAGNSTLALSEPGIRDPNIYDEEEEKRAVEGGKRKKARRDGGRSSKSRRKRRQCQAKETKPQTNNNTNSEKRCQVKGTHADAGYAGAAVEGRLVSGCRVLG